MKINEKVKEILFELTGMEVIANDAMLQDDLGMDSLAMVTLLIKIEEVFDIELSETDMNPFDLVFVHSVINMVKRYLGDEDE